MGEELATRVWEVQRWEGQRRLRGHVGEWQVRGRGQGQEVQAQEGQVGQVEGRGLQAGATGQEQEQQANRSGHLGILIIITIMDQMYSTQEHITHKTPTYQKINIFEENTLKSESN